jgi:hypothetical protein
VVVLVLSVIMIASATADIWIRKSHGACGRCDRRRRRRRMMDGGEWGRRTDGEGESFFAGNFVLAGKSTERAMPHAAAAATTMISRSREIPYSRCMPSRRRSPSSILG